MLTNRDTCDKKFRSLSIAYTSRRCPRCARQRFGSDRKTTAGHREEPVAGPDDSWPQVARRHSFAAMIGGRLCVYAVLVSLSVVGRAYGGGAGQRFGGAVCNRTTEPLPPKGQAATGGGNVTKGLLPSNNDDNDCRTVANLGEGTNRFL